MNKKLGRKPAVHSFHTMRSALVMAWHLNNLGVPPSDSDDWVKAVDAHTGGDWGMDGNDNYGDCTCADCSHGTMLWTANAGTIVVPTVTETLALYTAITGFNPNDPNTDQGADMVAVCNYLVQTGYMGSKLNSFAAVDPNNAMHLKWGVQLFGCVKLGLNLPNTAETQFDNHQPWSVVPGATIEGGHDVLLVKYTPSSWYVVTWGALQEVTPNFINTYCDEALMPLANNWLQAGGMAPNNLDLAQLESDLRSLKS